MARFALDTTTILAIAQGLSTAAWLDSGTATSTIYTDVGDSGANDAVDDLQSWNTATQSDIQQKLQTAADNVAAAAHALTEADNTVAHAATGAQ